MPSLNVIEPFSKGKPNFRNFYGSQAGSIVSLNCEQLCSPSFCTSRWRLITGARGEGLSIGGLISDNLQYTPSLNFIRLLRVIFSSQRLKWNEIQATVYPFCWNFTISQIFSWRFLWKFKQQKAITQSIQELRAFSRKMLIWLGLEFDE